ncbi:hypothetical protein EYZ11_012871 [Aspergillus tanneri]|uniref:Uncharacterized protein n=1 Tax=Aspergillus tanneri TaxID=1220188 RepID=A0A4S3IZ39_9EURO|nr:hypothetical protein EYZ11_012871 [Aspergillus tanneri]
MRSIARALEKANTDVSKLHRKDHAAGFQEERLEKTFSLIQPLAAELATVRLESERRQEEIYTAKRQHTKNQEELKALQKQLNEERLVKVKAITRMNDLRADLEQIQGQIDAERATLSGMIAAIKEALTTQKQQFHKEVAEHNVNVQRLQSNLDSALKNIARLVQEQESATQKLTLAETRYKKAEAETETFQSQLTNEIVAKRKAETMVRELETKLSEMQERDGKANEEMSLLIKELDNLQHHLQKLEKSTNPPDNTEGAKSKTVENRTPTPQWAGSPTVRPPLAASRSGQHPAHQPAHLQKQNCQDNTQAPVIHPQTLQKVPPEGEAWKEQWQFVRAMAHSQRERCGTIRHAVAGQVTQLQKLIEWHRCEDSRAREFRSALTSEDAGLELYLSNLRGLDAYAAQQSKSWCENVTPLSAEYRAAYNAAGQFLAHGSALLDEVEKQIAAQKNLLDMAKGKLDIKSQQRLLEIHAMINPRWEQPNENQLKSILTGFQEFVLPFMNAKGIGNNMQKNGK